MERNLFHSMDLMFGIVCQLIWETVITLIFLKNILKRTFLNKHIICKFSNIHFYILKLILKLHCISFLLYTLILLTWYIFTDFLPNVIFLWFMLEFYSCEEYLKFYWCCCFYNVFLCLIYKCEPHWAWCILENAGYKNKY